VEPETEKELEATLAARRELGPEHDPQLIAGFLDRIEKEIDRRVDQRLAERGPRRKSGSGSALHPANLALCIPIVAIAGGIGHTAGLIVAFLALAVVFLVSELRR
jgi:Flp pilus assembly protein TadB